MDRNAPPRSERIVLESSGIAAEGNVYALVLLQVLCSSFAGVYTERLLKGEALNKASGATPAVSLQNAALYVWTIACNACWMWYRGTLGDASRASNLRVLASPMVFTVILISSTGGIVTGYFLKHLDSIRRTIASAIEVFTCVLAAWLLFGVALTAATIVAAGLVCTGVCLYSSTDSQQYLSRKGFAWLSLCVGVLAVTVHSIHPTNPVAQDNQPTSSSSPWQSSPATSLLHEQESASWQAQTPCATFDRNASLCATWSFRGALCVHEKGACRQARSAVAQLRVAEAEQAGADVRSRKQGVRSRKQGGQDRHLARVCRTRMAPKCASLHWHAIIAGGGPAGTGPLISAVREGRWSNLMATHRILIVEESMQLVAGQFQQFSFGYSNSIGPAWSHQVRGRHAARFFPNASAAAAALPQGIATYRQAGTYLATLGDELASRVREAGSAVWLESTVQAVRVLQAHFEVTIRSIKSGHGHGQSKQPVQSVQRARYVVIAMGGVDKPPPPYLQNLMTAAAGAQPRLKAVLTVKQVVADPHALFQLVDRCANGVDSSVVVVGGSHSAMQLVIMLSTLVHARSCSRLRLTLIRRRPTPIYFESTALARRANYSFDAADVCPITDKVNRFSGVRGIAADLSVELLNGRHGNHHFASFRIVESSRADPTFQEEMRAIVANSDLAFTAVGFTARTPRLSTADGKPLKLAVSATDGQVESAPTSVGGYLTKAADGTTIERLLMYGLGAGWALAPEFGGEPRLYGKSHLDGVWLYQFDIGHRVLDELLLHDRHYAEGLTSLDTSSTSEAAAAVITAASFHGGASVVGAPRSSGWHAIYEAKAQKSIESVPLHHLGGFDMFTDEQWTDHVSKVLAPMQPLLRGASVFENGVGCGAFVNEWKMQYPLSLIQGLDYSASSVAVANRRVNGTFAVGRADDISATPAFVGKRWDYVVSYGVTLYLNDLAQVSRMVHSMAQHAKRWVFIGEINDAALQAQANAKRARTHTAATQNHRSRLPTPSQLYIPKLFFYNLSSQLNVRLTIQDHRCLLLEYPTAEYRYSVYMDMNRPFDAGLAETQLETSACQMRNASTPTSAVPWQQEVDIVIPWAGLSTNFSAKGVEVYRDRYNGELPYLLRSIAMHAPWVRKIWIMLNGHVPEDAIEVPLMLRARTRFVDRCSFMPSGTCPTRSGMAVPAFAHRFKPLAPRFVYTADDVFLGRPIALSDLYTKDGLPYVWRKQPRWSQWGHDKKERATTFHRMYEDPSVATFPTPLSSAPSPHYWYPQLKATCADMERAYPEFYAFIGSHVEGRYSSVAKGWSDKKNSQEEDWVGWMNWIYLRNGTGVYKSIERKRHTLWDEVVVSETGLLGAQCTRPMFMNVNDHAENFPTGKLQDQVTMFKAAMETIFPADLKPTLPPSKCSALKLASDKRRKALYAKALKVAEQRRHRRESARHD